MNSTDEVWGRDEAGRAVHRITLTGGGGARAVVSTFGATLQGLWLPDARGALADVVLGFDTLAPYLGDHPFFGSTIGRYANRIARARFELLGEPFALTRNDGLNHLHGGPRGLHHQTFAVEARDPSRASVTLFFQSADGEEGYPGRLDVLVTYWLTGDALVLEYEARTTRPTIVNLTNHAYFNLAGSGDVLAHELRIDADRVVPIDAAGIPLGGVAPVEGTELDCRRGAPVRAYLDAGGPQLEAGRGLDHCWLLRRRSAGVERAARLRDPASGRALAVWTTEPGLQIYTGNRLNGAHVGKGGVAYGPHAGICLEAQHLPDSPHHMEFPSTTLLPAETYTQRTEYRFSTER